MGSLAQDLPTHAPSPGSDASDALARSSPSGAPGPPKRSFWRYFLLGTAFWFAVDFTTAFAPSVHRWVSFMPATLLFYFGSPLVFAYLIYRKGWTDRRLLLPLLGDIFVVEILFSHNALLFTFPLLLLFIPVAIAIYSLLAFVPRWIVDGKLAQHRWTTVLLVAVWLVVALLSTASRAHGGG